MTEPTIRNTVVRESIVLAFTVASAVIVARLMGHDVTKTLRIKTLFLIKRYSQSQVDAWQKVADIAATSYHKAQI